MDTKILTRIIERATQHSANKNLIPISNPPPPGEAHFAISNVTTRRSAKFYVPDPFDAALHLARRVNIIGGYGLSHLLAREEAGLPPVNVDGHNVLGLAANPAADQADIIARESARFAYFAFLGQYAARQGAPEIISDEAFLELIREA